MDFAYLKKAHHGLCIVVDNTKKEGEEVKILANNALSGIVLHPFTFIFIVPTNRLSAMQPLIDPDATLRRAADTKATLKELQEDLAACMASFFFVCF